MIGYLKGKILSLSEDTALIETGGVGYEVLCSASALASLSGKTDGEVYTYLQVREDGISYSKFINGLAKAGITLNRKMLSEMAIKDPVSFKQLVDVAKQAQA